MRYGFITCVRLGEACIEELLALDADLVLLGTLTDDQAQTKSGRVRLDQVAGRHHIPLMKFRNVNQPSTVESLRAAHLDWLFIVGWSQIARTPVLEAATYGALGMHPTLLPKGRGRASIPWAIIKGLDETGVTMFKIDAGVDTGPIIAQEPIPVSNAETSSTLYDKVLAAHRRLVRLTWESLESGAPSVTAQDESDATVWPGRKPEDGAFSPEGVTGVELDRLVRALTHPCNSRRRTGATAQPT